MPRLAALSAVAWIAIHLAGELRGKGRSNREAVAEPSATERDMAGSLQSSGRPVF